MADGVVLNSGSGGVTAATDDCGAAGHAQVVKLAISADGSATAIPADATNGIDVDVTRVIPGTSATHLGKAEDAAHASGDTGVMALSVRQDTAAATSGTDGDYQPLITDANGRLHVNGSGVTQPVSAASLPLPSGAATAAKQPALGTAGSASADVISIQGVASMTAVKTDGSGVTQPVSGTVTVQTGQSLDYDTGAGTQTTQIVGLALPASGGPVAGGTSSNPVRTDPTGTTTQPVSLASVPSHAVTNAGTFAVQVDGNALTALQLIDDVVVTEDAAHSSGDKGVMALAVRRDANTTLADTTGDYAPLQVDSGGNLKVAIISGAGSGGTSATDDAAFSVASGSGTPIMGLADETSPDSVDEGDVGVVRMTLTRALHVNLRDAAGAELSVGGGTQYTEDAAAAANPVGTVPMLVRKDTPADEVSADGDNIAQRASKYGAGYVTMLDASGNVVSGGTQYTEDAAAAADPVGSAVILVRKDTPASVASADGDNVAQRGGNYGNAYVTLVDSSGGFVSVGGGTQYTQDAALTVGSTVGTMAMARASAAVPTDVSADGDAVLPWHLRSGAAAVQPTYAGVLAVAGNGAAGTGVQRVTLANDSTGVLATVSTVTTVTTLTGAGVAHDATDSGNPHKIGAKAETSPKGITVVADGDRTDLYADADGQLIVKLNTSGADLISERVSNTDGSSTAFSNFSAVASTKNAVTAVTVFRTDSGSSLAYVDFRDGTAGSVIWSMPLPPNGGSTVSAAVPLFKTSANTALAYDVSSALNAVIISVSGFQTKV